MFSLRSPLQWFGNTLDGLGTVVNHSKMGPHVLIA